MAITGVAALNSPCVRIVFSIASIINDVPFKSYLRETKSQRALHCRKPLC